jgi:required for meiotic nuclear division protein 1
MDLGLLARYELEISDSFNAIEPLAVQMKSTPRKLPWKQSELVHQIGDSMLVEHQLVGRAEILEKPELDRLYARLEDEYELRERVLALERKLEVVSRAAQTMLDLHQAKRSLNVEYYIVVLIVFEIALALIQLFR